MKKSCLAASALAPVALVLVLATVNSCGSSNAHPPPPPVCDDPNCGVATHPPVDGGDTGTDGDGGGDGDVLDALDALDADSGDGVGDTGKDSTDGGVDTGG